VAALAFLLRRAHRASQRAATLTHPLAPAQRRRRRSRRWRDSDRRYRLLTRARLAAARRRRSISVMRQRGGAISWRLRRWSYLHLRHPLRNLRRRHSDWM
jgi:hypothetical protein